MSRYSQHVNVRATPQSEPIPGREAEQVVNSAGGYVFPVTNWVRLDRFLILGNEGGTYYSTERKLTLENAKCVRVCLAEDAERTIRTIVQVSDSGRAPKNDPAIFALAIAAADPHSNSRSDSNPMCLALRSVCRTGTHLFQFVECVKTMRGWGPFLRRMVGSWYSNQEASDLAFQVTKYVQRGGWSHKDVLRRTGPAAPTPNHEAIYRWIAKGFDGMGARSVKRGEVVSEYPGLSQDLLPEAIFWYEATKKATAKDHVIRLIRDHRIPREYLEGSHSEMLNDPEVWDALLSQMPLTAMIRNLGKMSAVGLLKPLSAASTIVASRLGDAEYIAKSRVHPIALLLALKTYASGHGVKGSLKWTPVSQVNDALDAAFYLAFLNVEPAKKRTMIALDVSGSMSCGCIAGTTLTPREGAAAMAMIIAKTEPAYQIMAFGNQFVPLDISRCERLASVVHKTDGLPFGGTDCALPMRWSESLGVDVDTFLVITDNETLHGNVHPSQALRRYRERRIPGARMAVMAMTSTGFSIADPKDAGMLDVVGFDAAAPNIINDFSRDKPL